MEYASGGLSIAGLEEEDKGSEMLGTIYQARTSTAIIWIYCEFSQVEREGGVGLHRLRKFVFVPSFAE